MTTIILIIQQINTVAIHRFPHIHRGSVLAIIAFRSDFQRF